MGEEGRWGSGVGRFETFVIPCAGKEDKCESGASIATSFGVGNKSMLLLPKIIPIEVQHTVISGIPLSMGQTPSRYTM